MQLGDFSLDSIDALAVDPPLGGFVVASFDVVGVIDGGGEGAVDFGGRSVGEFAEFFDASVMVMAAVAFGEGRGDCGKGGEDGADDEALVLEMHHCLSLLVALPIVSCYVALYVFVYSRKFIYLCTTSLIK